MIPLFKNLSSVTRESAIYRNGIVESHLFNSISPHLPLIGIIFQQWCNWLPALTLVPLEPRWVWVLDTHWLKICKVLHPNVVFIDGFTTSLPAVDILLLSLTSLHKCLIPLSFTPFSLRVSTSQNIRVNFGWKKSW